MLTMDNHRTLVSQDETDVASTLCAPYLNRGFRGGVLVPHAAAAFQAQNSFGRNDREQVSGCGQSRGYREAIKTVPPSMPPFRILPQHACGLTPAAPAA